MPAVEVRLPEDARMRQVEALFETERLEAIRVAQRAWALVPIEQRVAVIGRLRRRVASRARELAEIVPTHLPGASSRTVADTLVAEVLPLIEACRFLEREARRILRTKMLGRRGRPLWLGAVSGQVERAPWGVVLVIGPANYPLFLAGVQVLQALAAGNAVLWKPAPGTEAVADRLRTMLLECGLVPELLTVLDPGVESAVEAMAVGVDHVVLTGSAATGKAVLRRLAETLTPATMELSGCDAVFVLPGADVGRVIEALAFGLRFNGSFTCMAPRRVFLVGFSKAQAAELEMRLAFALDHLEPVELSKRGTQLLRELVADARAQGAEIRLDGLSVDGARVTLITGATPSLRSMQEDVFAPVLSVMRTADVAEALAASAACPYALTVSIFCADGEVPENEARALAARLPVGHVVINDVILPTADPRIAFGGRGSSGFGVTRGAEGLLAMTTPKTVQIRRKKPARAYQPTGDGHIELFAGLAQMLHGGGLSQRWAGLRRVVRAAKRLQ